LGRSESLHTGDAADSLLANVEFYFLLRDFRGYRRQPTTLEDALWLSCWQACGTERLVLHRREM